MAEKGDRFLRSAELRNILYEAAGGRCQMCGVDLEEGWHADHIVPWSANQNTNVHQMQALCPTCNVRKGAKVQNVFDFNPNLRGFRRHQHGAYEAIVERCRRGEESAGIVLPPRYGKSDVIRMSAIRMIRERIISRAFFVTPSSVLTAQLIDEEKVADMARRYQLGSLEWLSVYPVEHKPAHPFPRVHIAAMNIQLANRNLQFFSELVKDTIDRTGLRPAVFFDEAHTSSRENAWGNCIRTWQNAGAFLVVLTATPYRADKGRIPGFSYVPMGNEPVTIRRRTGERQITISEGFSQLYEIKADYAATFRQVWDEEPSPVLCKVTRRPYEVNLSRIDGLTGDLKETQVLSELTQEDTERNLMRILKDQKVIGDGCFHLQRELSTRKSDAPDAAAIVFVGNDDRELEDEDNKHARDVESALSTMAPELKVLRATSKDVDPDGVIRRFIRGEGDVLIVKFMGGVGLDIPRLKVCLDLSRVRTRAAFIQRLTRICTVWDPTGKPEDLITTADYISPADCFSAALFQALITDQGGDARELDTQDVRNEDADYPEQEPLPDYFQVTGTDRPESFEDSDKRSTPGEKLDFAQRMAEAFPEIANRRTKNEIVERAEAAGISEAEIPQSAYEPTEIQTPAQPSPRSDANGTGFHNLGDELKRKRGAVTQRVRKLTHKRLGPGFAPRDREWVAEVKSVYVELYRATGVQGPPSKIADPADLDRLCESLDRELERHSNPKAPTGGLY